jgi:hypothetical protein
LELRFAFGQKHGRKAKCATSDQKLGLKSRTAYPLQEKYDAFSKASK